MPLLARVAVALLMSSCLCGQASTRAETTATESLLDGTSLAGWDGDPAVWSVQGGCIVGSTTGAPIAQNTFLIWRGGELRDFELSFAVRLEGDNNSGVQYRSRRIDALGFAVGGYQCDVHADPRYLGMLYEERGAGIVATHGQKVARAHDGNLRVLAQTGDAGVVDLAQWHTMRIVARGNTVQHWLDGRLAVEVTDDAASARRSGCLALQVHSGAPMTVWFRDLALRRLPTEEIAMVPPAAAIAAGRAPQWIWDAQPQDGEEVFFRRAFALPAVPRSATLAVTCDNHCRVYVNGEKVTKSDVWEAPRVLDIARLLRAGDNVLAVHGWNDSGPAGLCAQLIWSSGEARGVMVSDGDFCCSSDDPDGWNAAGFDAAKWAPATVLAPLGGGPWAATLPADAFADAAIDDAPQRPQPAPELNVEPSWRAERLLAVPRAFGSWVCLARDPAGRLYASDQTRGLFRILPAGVGGRADTAIERIDVDLDGCQGLCWAFGALYAVANGGHSGLYRLTDRDGDDRLDRVELLRALDGNGEHGPHAVVVAPDGEHLLVLCGNHTKVPDLAASRVPRNWQEDSLLPRIDDPNGHAVGIRAPGGFVCEVDREGQHWELYCCGFRNAYDLAVLDSGDVVTFDADMEWDMGLPWYRPTRILQVLSGVDYGWRSGSTKWATDYPDTLRGIVDVGPGSPTGLCASKNGALALDWTFGLVHEIGLVPTGGSFDGSVGAFANGQPLPVTDVVAVAGDGGHGEGYCLLTGGRGVPSTLYRVVLQALGRGHSWADYPPVRRDERVALEVFHGRVDAGAVAAAWPRLGDDDAVLRHAARIAIESQPVAQWRERALGEATVAPVSALTALLALARQGVPADLPDLLQALARLDFGDLDAAQRVAWLRVHALALLRLGPVEPAAAVAVADRLLARFPCGDERVDAELCALLACLDASGLLDKALPLLEPMRPAPAPAWAEVAARNRAYGGAIQKMLGAMPPVPQIAIANALRTVPSGWTTGQRQQYFAFLAAARRQSGGASYDGYLQAMVDAVWAQCSDDERQQLAVVAGKDEAMAAVAAAAAFQAVPPKGPGRQWQLAEATALARKDLGERAGTRDLAAGRNLFHAANCAHCHRFAGEGGGSGPDLTSLGNKFRAADVLEAILEPGKVISDQFAGSVLTRKDGSTLFGRTSERTVDGVPTYEVVTATAAAAVVRVDAADVQKVEPSRLSPMPAGLVDPLSEQELMDLVAFLLSRGEAPAKDR